MPVIPPFQSRQQVAPVYQERAPSNLGQEPLQAQARLGAAMAELGTRITETVQETQYQDGLVRFAERFAGFREELSREPDPDRIRERWHNDGPALIREIGESIPDGRARRAFEQSARISLAREGVDIRRLEGTRATERANATIIVRRGQLAEEAARDPARAAVLAAEYDDLLRGYVRSGAIREDRAEQLRAQFPRQVTRARTARDVEQNPAATRRRLIEEPQRGAALTPEDREEFVAVADAHIAENELVADIAAKRAEELPWQQATAQTAETMGKFWEAAATGTGDPVAMQRDLEWNRNIIPTSAYELGRRVLRGDVARSDDADTVQDLIGRVADDPEDFRRAADAALGARRITPQRYQELSTRNAQAQGNSPAHRAYRAERSSLAQAFDGPEEMNFSPARVQALSDFDTWVSENPRATAPEVRQAAEEIIGTYRPGAVARGRASLPAPYAFAGWPDAVDDEVISAAEEALVTDLDAGNVSNAEAARAARVLNAWRYALRQTETPR